LRSRFLPGKNIRESLGGFNSLENKGAPTPYFSEPQAKRIFGDKKYIKQGENL
jgi:hypothetical protein